MLTACPGNDTSGTEEVGDTSSESSSTTDDPTTTTSTTDDPTTETSTTDDPTESTTDDPTESTTDDPTSESTTDDPTTESSTTDDPMESTTDDPTTETETDGGSCGDGVWGFGEDCDGADIFGSCTDFGYPGGELSCSASCTFDFSGCNDCGNGVIDMGEVCDGSDLDGQTCGDFGFMFGELACSPTCDSVLEASCSNIQSWSEHFEGGAMLPAPWMVGGDAPWFGSGASVHAGMFAGQSGNIGDDQTTTMQITRNFVSPGTLRFWYRVSTEGSWDYLRFYIDGTPQDEWSGDIPWTQSALYPLAAGNHTFMWEYSKDGSLDEFEDTVWIDDIVSTNATP